MQLRAVRAAACGERNRAVLTVWHSSDGGNSGDDALWRYSNIGRYTGMDVRPRSLLATIPPQHARVQHLGLGLALV